MTSSSVRADLERMSKEDVETIWATIENSNKVDLDRLRDQDMHDIWSHLMSPEIPKTQPCRELGYPLGADAAPRRTGRKVRRNV